ncbi:unnamed protein product [Caenorhabditis bovis]|uniref:Uncharacterized protein n=1 Tax=Caenorhabditis bovis TaxID=2654633 RepID=A0A8S1F132_9PELO|nr:unnamed protein product [Caenorhabditis bovis]
MQSDGTDFVDEDAPINNAALDPTLGQEDQQLVRVVLLLIVAGKVTWYAQLHHLGVKTKAGVPTGYFAKVVAVVGKSHPAVDIDSRDEASVSRVYQAIHSASTIAVLKVIFTGKPFVQDLQHIVRVPSAGGFPEISIDTDIILRQNGLQAGFASLSDVIAATMPEITVTYQTAQAHPFRHKISSNYICGPNVNNLDRFDKEPYSVLISACTSVIQVLRGKSTLDRAQIFATPAEKQDGHDPNWHKLVKAYPVFRVKNFGNADDFLAKVTGESQILHQWACLNSASEHKGGG